MFCGHGCKHRSGGVTLKLGIAFLILLAVLPLAVPSTLAAGGKAEAEVNPSAAEGNGGGSDPNSAVDRHEPRNNECTGAEEWPATSVATSSGIVGWKDPADWSVVELHRTESLTAHVEGAASLLYAPDCSTEPDLVAPLNVRANGKYPLRVSPAADTAKYAIEYTITPNDASGPGTDVGNVAAAAFYYNALPRSVDPREHFFVSGSLPNRHDLSLDQDWFRIGTGMAHALDPGDLTLGLLTVTFSADCNGGSYRLSLVGADGLSEILTTSPGCGTQQLSCIAAGFSPIYAKTEVTDGRGTGYDFSADLSPLYVVSVSSGRVTLPDSAQPWCDPLTPVVLGLAGSDRDIIDKQGQVVAKVTSPAFW